MVLQRSDWSKGIPKMLSTLNPTLPTTTIAFTPSEATWQAAVAVFVWLNHKFSIFGGFDIGQRD